jgi:hypothetical protein
MQSTCFTKGTHDHWVTNISKCPVGYKYVSSGEVGSKCCLKLSEWTEITIKSRYTNAICPSIEGLSLIDQFIKYFKTLKEYETNTITTLTKIINNNTALQNDYIGILDSLEAHYKANHVFLDDFTKVLRKYAGDNTTESSTYDIFNCSILRNDMLAFYDNIYNKFYSFSLLNIFSFACFGLFSYINVYIIIRSIYIVRVSALVYCIPAACTTSIVAIIGHYPLIISNIVVMFCSTATFTSFVTP